MDKLEAIKSLKNQEPGFIFSIKKNGLKPIYEIYIICENGYAKELSFNDVNSTIHLSSRRYSVEDIIDDDVIDVLALESNKYKDLSQAIFVLYSLETKEDRSEIYNETKAKIYRTIINILS